MSRQPRGIGEVCGGTLQFGNIEGTGSNIPRHRRGVRATLQPGGERNSVSNRKPPPSVMESPITGNEKWSYTLPSVPGAKTNARQQH